MEEYDEKRGSALKGWCITWKKKDGQTYEDVKTACEAIADKWCFQDESGVVTGYAHWQITVNTRSAQRLADVAAHFDGGHCTPISKAGAKGAWDYVSKVHTRVAGPWSSGDIIDSKMPADVKVMTTAPHDWQVQVIDILQKPWTPATGRLVHIIVDVVGNNGKSTLAKYMKFMRAAGLIRPDDAKGMVRSAYDQWSEHKYSAWMVDLPRQNLPQRLMDQFWIGVETIKTGEYEDDRHTHKGDVVTNPNMVLFSNYLPETNLSDDRLRIWLLWERRLIPYTIERHRKVEALVVIKKQEAFLAAKAAAAVAAAHDPLDDIVV